MDEKPGSPAGLGTGRRRKAELAPICDAADLLAVAEFLRANHNDQLPWAQACTTVPRGIGPPNYGFLLRDGQRVVGCMLAVYSQRNIEGRVERFCNLGSWCVLPEYRYRSMSLLNAALAQDGYHFTALSPDDGPREILACNGFGFLDTAAVLVPNVPGLLRRPAVTVTDCHDAIEDRLSGTDLEIFRSHASVLAARHVLTVTDARHCHVMYREFRHRGIPVFAEVLYVSDQRVFRESMRAFTGYLLRRRRMPATLAEVRVIGYRPRCGLALDNWPKMFRSSSLNPEHVDYLYSELVYLPWLRRRGGTSVRR